MSCSNVYPIPIPRFSPFLLSSPCCHHQFLTFTETYPSHCSSTQSQLFHISNTLPQHPLLFTEPSLPGTQNSYPPCFPLTLCVLKGMCHCLLPSSPHILLTIVLPSFSFAYSHLSHSGNTCPAWHTLLLQCELPACFAMTQSSSLAFEELSGSTSP